MWLSPTLLFFFFGGERNAFSWIACRADCRGSNYWDVEQRWGADGDSTGEALQQWIGSWMNRIWRGDKSNGEEGRGGLGVCECVCVSHTPAGWVLLPINWGGVCVNVCVSEASLRHSATYEPSFDDPRKRIRIRSWSILTDTAFFVLCGFTVVHFHRFVLWSTYAIKLSAAWHHWLIPDRIQLF